jgi:hypothetical protein
MKELYMTKEKECMQLKQKAIAYKKELEECQSAIVIAEYNRQKVSESLK